MSKFELVLFDIDGTLLYQNGVVDHGIGQALESVYGRRGPIAEYRMSGKTDPQIMKELMLLAGLALPEIESGLAQCCQAYIDVLGRTIQNFHLAACPGVGALLQALSKRPSPLSGLLTGNLAGVVGPKLKAAGIPGEVFALGAYGSDDPDRNHLPGVAMARAERRLGRPVAPGSVLIIGDTPHDIAGARAGGTQVMAVATGEYSRARLASHHPDYLLDDLSNLEMVLATLCG